MTEWVVIVKTRSERGIEVQFPLGGRALKLPLGRVRRFVPSEYPIQISAEQRKRIKGRGQTPKDEIEKVCNQCLTIKPVEAFAANQTRKDGSTIYRPTCASCREGVDGVRNHIRRRDGSTPEKPPVGEFWQCPICEKSGIMGVTVKIVLDHDHLTGDARDYICDSCNTGLDRFRNGKNYLGNAMAFIEMFE